MPRKKKPQEPSVAPEGAPKNPRVRNKLIPIGTTGRLWLRIGRMTKAEEDAFWRRNGEIVGFTRSAPRSAPLVRADGEGVDHDA